MVVVVAAVVALEETLKPLYMRECWTGYRSELLVGNTEVFKSMRKVIELNAFEEVSVANSSA